MLSSFCVISELTWVGQACCVPLKSVMTVSNELPQLSKEYQPAVGAPAPSGPRLDSFLDVVRLADLRRDARLKVELESFVHLIAFEPGRIELRLHDRAPGDLAGRLMQRLKEWTGRQWVVSVNAQGAGRDTLRDARTAEALAHPLVRKALEVFPGAEIISIRDPRTHEEPATGIAPGEDESE